MVDSLLKFAPLRRWFRLGGRRMRFSLRTLLMLTAVAAVGVWFVIANIMPLREREQMMHTHRVRFDFGHRNRLETRLPLVWTLLGARCYDIIEFPIDTVSEEKLERNVGLVSRGRSVALIRIWKPRRIGSRARKANWREAITLG